MMKNPATILQEIFKKSSMFIDFPWKLMKNHYKNSGTHELGPPKHYKNPGTHDSGAIFLKPKSCVPLFSRAGIVHTATFSSHNAAYPQFVREKYVLIRIANSWRKCLFESPLLGGAQPGPKSEKMHREYNRKPYIMINSLV